MTHIAKLYLSGRSGERQAIDADATFRRSDQTPLDVQVTDLSFTGCRIECGNHLPFDEPITIGFAGIGQCPGRIVWAAGHQHGCQFDSPLTQEELAAALKAPINTVAALSTDRPTPSTAGDELSDRETRLSPVTRLMIVVGVAAGLWVPIIVAVAWLRA